MSRFEALGNYVYEDGNRIGCTPEESSAELARKLNAYQMRVERFKAENAQIKFKSECQAEGLNAFDNKLREAEAENARLKAEVENSKRINTELLALSNRQASDIRRLTKAGDDLAANIGNDERSQDICADAWRAAKKGGQP
jgi:predicted RNase H-like nuclease (RuvC/YqgF family)